MCQQFIQGCLTLLPKYQEYNQISRKDHVKILNGYLFSGRTRFL